MANQIPQDTKNKIVDLYISGVNITQISKQVSISTLTITKILKNFDIKIRKTNGKELNLNNETINELYTNGLSTYQIAEKFNCSDETIRKHIKQIKSIKDRNTRTTESKNKIKETCRKLWENEQYKQKTKEQYNKWAEIYTPPKGIKPPPLTQNGIKKISESVKKRFENQEFLQKHKIRCSESNKKHNDKILLDRKNSFIEKSAVIHNFKYDYSKIDYISAFIKIEIICPEHGSFWQTPNSHTIGHGCPTCYKSSKKTTKQFIEEAIKIHGNTYDYSKVNYIDNKTKIEIICKKHGPFLQMPNSHTYRQFGCRKCRNMISNLHQKLLNYLNLPITIINNDIITLNGLEIDILFPNYNVGIEINGGYWHGLRSNNGSRHSQLMKTHHLKATLAQKSGIKLFQFWDFEINNKLELIKSMIYNSIGLSNKIHARKCEIIQLDNKTAKDFFDQSHLQGHRNASIIYGLTLNNEIQCAISFSKHHKYQWEIMRYANKLNINVVGGFSKLLNHFTKKHNPKQILTFADRRISNGYLYLKNGFNLLETTKPNYFYWKNDLILSRQQCQKHKLQKLLGDSYDHKLSETENMLLNSYSKVYDAGHIKLTLKP